MTIRLSIVAASIVLASLAACGGGSGGDNSALNPNAGLVWSGNPAALKVTETIPGADGEASVGKTATVNYSGWLYDDRAVDFKGTRFASASYTYVVGSSNAIAGFDRGVTGMKVGGKRIILVPSSLGYGANGSPPKIPANVGLVFEVELASVK